jgi:hypothetical protein
MQTMEHSMSEQSLGRQGVAPAAYTVDEFCEAHRLSRSKLYQLWDAGIGPRKMNVDKKVRITVEAAADWRREREAASEAA